MSGMLYDPDEWQQILRAMKEDRFDGALNTLHQRDLRADAQFQVIDANYFQPTLVQGVTTISYTALAIEGLRVGPWVQLNVAVQATSASAGNGSITLTLPSLLPARAIAHRTIGTFFFWDDSAGTVYHAAAVTGVVSNLLVYGSQDQGAFETLHGSVAIAIGDRVGYSVQYLVDPTAL